MTRHATVQVSFDDANLFVVGRQVTVAAAWAAGLDATAQWRTMQVEHTAVGRSVIVTVTVARLVS